jgi:hypothetical protein
MWLLRAPQKPVTQEIEDVAETTSHLLTSDAVQFIPTETNAPADRLGHDSEHQIFDRQYAEFLQLTHPETAREECMTKRPMYRWGTPLGIHPQTEIPESLLRGPWSPDMIKYLFWLTRAGARIDYSASTNGEVRIACIVYFDMCLTDLCLGSKARS